MGGWRATVVAACVLATRVRARGPTPLLDSGFIRQGGLSRPRPQYKTREIEIKALPEKVCPSGFIRDGAHCVRAETSTVTHSCPEGWTPSPDGQNCQGYVTVAPDLTCYEGINSQSQCTKELVAPKLATCPDGFILDENAAQCMKSISAPALAVCPSETRLLDGICHAVVSEPPHLVCPSGHDLVNNVCQQTIEEPLEVICPTGFQLNGKTCTKEIQTPGNLRCSQGFALIMGKCAREDRTAPVATCPIGDLIGNACVTVNRQEPMNLCPPGFNMANKGEICEKDEVVSPHADCSKNTSYDPTTGHCVDAHKVKHAALSCPPGYRFVGKTACVIHKQTPPTPTCPSTHKLTADGMCALEQRSSPEYHCVGRGKLVGKMCLSIQLREPYTVCPENSQQQKGICHSRASAEPMGKCPPGYTWGPSRGVCMRTNSRAPAQRCPPNTQERVEKSTTVCVSQIESAAQYTCPDDQKLENQECLLNEIRPPYIACPDGYFEDIASGTCFTTTSSTPTAICPDRFHLFNDKCVQRQTTPMLSLCPPGFTLSLESTVPLCEKRVKTHLLHVCPAGFTLNDVEECIAKKVKYEFDHPEAENPEEAEAPEEEAQEPLGVPEAASTTTTTTQATVVVQIQRPIVQKGIVQRSQPITLSGPAAEVARQQAIIQAGGTVPGLDAESAYVPPTVPSRL